MRNRFTFLALAGLTGLLLLACSSEEKIPQAEPQATNMPVGDTTEIAEGSPVAIASKMNVLYMGVENPIHLEEAGDDPASWVVAAFGAGSNIRTTGPGTYVVSVSSPGEVSLLLKRGTVSKRYSFRVKYLPDPVARLGRFTGGVISGGEFRAQGGLIAAMDNFDFQVNCEIQGFNLTKIGRDANPVEVGNPGARFNEQSQKLIATAKPGDFFLFTNVKARCPGDGAGRTINSLAFQIR